MNDRTNPLTFPARWLGGRLAGILPPMPQAGTDALGCTVLAAITWWLWKKSR